MTEHIQELNEPFSVLPANDSKTSDARRTRVRAPSATEALCEEGLRTIWFSKFRFAFACSGLRLSMSALAIKYEFSVGHPSRGAMQTLRMFLPFYHWTCIMTVIHNQAGDKIDKGRGTSNADVNDRNSHANWTKIKERKNPHQNASMSRVRHHFQ